MRTARALTVSQGVYLVWGVLSPGGVYLVPGMYLVTGGILSHRGVYLVTGGVLSPEGTCPAGVPAQGVVSGRGRVVCPGTPPHTPPVYRILDTRF